MVTTSARTRGTFLHRLIGAVALRVTTYEEVEADRRATGQAVRSGRAVESGGGIRSATVRGDDRS